MPEPDYRAIKSMDDLFKEMGSKYSKTPNFRSNSRFPSLLIFFNNKDDYTTFIERCEYRRIILQSFISEDQKVSREACDRWLSEAESQSKNEVIMILPASEMIRLRFFEQKERMCDYVFGRILQAEDSKIVVPILDYLNEYKSFFRDFEHTARCGETWYLSSEIISVADRLTIYVDRKRLIQQSDIGNDSRYVNALEDWLDVWSSNGLRTTKRIVIQYPDLIEPILKRGIAVPTVDICIIENEGQYLKRFYGMDDIPDEVSLGDNQWKSILDFVRAKDNRRYSWKRLNDEILGLEATSLGSLIAELWTDVQFLRRDLERHLWLIEARNRGKDDQEIGLLLSGIVEEIDNPSKLLDIIFKSYLEHPSHDSIVLDQRRHVFQQFKYGFPHFESGRRELEDFFDRHIALVPEDVRLQHLTGHFDFEKRYLVKSLCCTLSETGDVSSEVLLAMRSVWPPFYDYISPAFEDHKKQLEIILSLPRGELSNSRNFRFFIECYMAEYVKSKLMDKSTDGLKLLQSLYMDLFREINAKTRMGILGGLNNKTRVAEMEKNRLVLLDCVGFEWSRMLANLLNSCNWSVVALEYNMAALPSDTSHCPVVAKAEKKYQDFDKLIHKPYQYPDSIFEEVQCLTQTIESFDRDYRGSDRLMLFSDHGCTALARKGNKIALDANQSHGGRYALVEIGKELKYEGNDACWVKEPEENAIVMIGYANINEKPKGESHGGATMEEMVTIQISIERKAMPIDEIRFSAEGEHSLLDDSVIFSISLPHHWCLEEFEIQINGHLPLKMNSNCIKNSEFFIRMSILRQHGLTEGDNIVRVGIGETGEASCILKIAGATKNTNFDALF